MDARKPLEKRMWSYVGERASTFRQQQQRQENERPRLAWSSHPGWALWAVRNGDDVPRMPPRELTAQDVLDLIAGR